MSPARFRWGILFITVGVLLLLNNVGELDWWVWTDILSLWPLILIAIGLEKIFTKSKVEFLAYLPILGLAAVVFWVAFEGYSGGDSFISRKGGAYRYTVAMESDINYIQAKMDFGDVDVTLNNTGTRLFRARSDGWRMEPEVTFDRNGDIGKLEVTATRRRLPNWIRIDKWGERGDWNLYLTDRIPISLECTGDESDMTLDCRDIMLENLFVDSDAGDIRIQIGSLEDSVKVKLEGDRADYRLSVPAGCGLKIIGAGDELTGYFDREGLTETDGNFQSIGYETLSPKIELDLSGGLTQFALEFN